MEPATDSLAQALFDFRAQYLADQAAGLVPRLEVFLRRFPAFESEIRAAFLALASGDAAAESSAPELDPARRIGPYRLLRLLGRGGQGTVHLALDERLGRKVALKLLSGFSSFSPDARLRFRREAELASRLDHPGICSIYESGIEGEQAYLALRYVEGETLAARLTRARDSAARGAEVLPAAARDRRELEQCLALFEATARALHAAHQLGVLHRDLKPGNLMITPQGQAVLLDFGLAREIETDERGITRTGDVLGTPAYMSPEQIDPRGRRLDARSDVYSLAATLHECLTLERPFQAPTLDGLYQKILVDPPPDPRRANRCVPRDLVLVLQTALEKDRDRRYLSALEFAEELRRVRVREVIHARPPAPWLRGLRWVQRHPGRAVAGALLALLGAALLFGVLMRERAAALQLAEQDREFTQRLLDQLADTPRRGPHFDWAQSSQRALDEFARHALPLDGSRPADELARELLSIQSRAPELGEAVRDGLYRFAATLEDVEFGPKYRLEHVPQELQPARLREPRWAIPRGTVLALLERSELDPWRRAAWAAFQRTLQTGQDALEALLQAEDLARRSARDLVLLAEFVYLARRDDSALRLYDLAERAGVANADTRYVLRLSRGLLRARDPRGLDRAAAVLDLSVACELRPNSAPTWVGLATQLFLAEQPQRALHAAGRAVEADPRSSSAQALSALLLLRTGSLAEADAAAQRALELDPRDPELWCLRAEGRVVAGDLATAARCWRAAAQARDTLPSSPDEIVWTTAGLQLARARVPLTELQRFVETELEDDAARAALLGAFGSAASRAGELEPALAALERARELDPRRASTCIELARALESSCEPEHALRLLREALQLEPDSPGARKALAEALLSRGEAAQACAVLESGFRDEPPDAEYARLASNGSLAAGFPARALECACWALHAEPEDRRALELVIAAAARLGDAQSELDARIVGLEDQDESERETGIQRILALVASGRVDARALASTTRALRERHARSVSLCVLDAIVAFRAGEPERGEALLTMAAELDPRRALAVAYLGDLCVSRGELGQAEALLAAALEREPGSLLARGLAVQCAMRRQEFGSALAQALLAIQAGSTDEQTWRSALEAARLFGEYEPLLRAGRRALESGSTLPVVREVVLGCLSDLGRFDEACELVAGDLRAHPGLERVRLQLGASLLDAWRDCEAADVLLPLLSPATRTRDPGLAQQAKLLLERARTRCDASGEDPQPEPGDPAQRLTRLLRCGAFIAAAELLFPDGDGQVFASPEARYQAACVCAQAARQAGSRERAGKPEAPRESAPDAIRAAESARDERSRPVEAVLRRDLPAEVERYAIRALAGLEHDLVEVRARHSREADAARRAALRLHVEGELSSPLLAFLRQPPPAAPWAARAAFYFRSAREFVKAAR